MAFQEQTIAAKKALVIGIDDYGGAPNNLKCCVKDADTFTRVLRSYGFDDVHSLRDSEATVEKVDEQLRWLFNGRKSDDRIVLYFSGNGFTRSRNGIVEECLVLRNGLLDSERFLASASDLPVGILSVILDTSFSGTAEQFVASVSGRAGRPDIEIVRGKVWRPAPDEAARLDSAERNQRVSEYRRFACRPISSPTGIVNALALRAHAEAGAMRATAAPWSIGARAAASDEKDWEDDAEGEGQFALRGLMLCASLDAESAVASTSRTDGHSAFTQALVTAMKQVGPQATTPEIIAATRARLRALGFQQTPRLAEHTAAADLKLRRFLTLEQLSAAETLRVMSEPRYWEGVLTAATPSGSAWAVTQEVNQMTMQQPLTGSYQPLAAAYQQPFATSQYQQPIGTAQFANDDINRSISAIGPVLAAVIPAIVPQIVNSVLAQQRFGSPGNYVPSLTPQYATPAPFGNGLTPFGTVHQAVATSEDVQRLLPVLSSVLPAVVPQIVNNILAQQRAMSVPWGTPHGVPADAWGGSASPIGFQSPYAPATPFGRI